MKKIFLSIVMFFVFLTESVANQQIIETEFSLHQIIQNHPNVKRAYLQYQNAKNTTLNQYFFLIPERVETSLNILDYQEENPMISYKFRFSYRVLEPASFATIQENKSLEEASFFMYKSAYQQQLYNILVYGIEVDKNLNLAEIAKNNVLTFEEYTKGIEKKVNARNLSKTELSYAIARLAKYKGDSLKAEVDYKNSLLNLENVCFAKISEKELQKITNSYKKIIEEFEISSESYLQRFELQQLQALTKAGKIRLTATRLANMPSLNFNFETPIYTTNYAWQPNSPTWSAGLVLTIPIGNLAKNIVKAKSEKNNLDILSLEMNLLSFSIKNEIASRLNKIEFIENELEFYKRAYQLAEEAIEGITKEFEAGMRTSFDIIDARNFYYDALKNYTIKIYELQRYKIDYLLASGQLVKKLEKLEVENE
ncbi:MAG: TolC family protein [Spirochaetales bacterium]|nr:TolC family protein [Spirochaetales bacterium]